MIVATSNTFRKGIRVWHVINRDVWSTDDWWLFLLGDGFVPLVLAVRESDPQAAIDAIVDHPRWGRELTEDVEPCNECQQADDIEQQNAEMGQETPYEAIQHLRDQCSCDFAGNCGERIDLTRITLMEKCYMIDFFARKEQYGHLS